ncbi:condensation domain protein (plasmid) [Crinalium epipsammum PCC 9333]|uniref:Phthiocerol/phthiodiolone dimycocerosyl transferase n=1 Tax=Crinalium epipsammum PCC 9333 TaxID=1173022 RepID=K9W577_9CYAN|nr:condensation domain-containing protein [Crinalium epipsammum]AFZ15503.1 condensation domain protein [Crinalium epipsammum PCC 9333]
MNRLLGVSEHLRWLLDQRWSFNFILSARVTGAISVQQLTDALAWVQCRHPLLAVKIVTEDGQQPRFVSEGVPNIPLRVVKRQGGEHWCQEAEAELSLPFSWNSGPLLRVVFLQGEIVSELIITCHHSIGDGLSVIYLLRDILLEISTKATTREILPELPSWEERIFLAQGNISNNVIAPVALTEKKNKKSVSDTDMVLNRVSNQEVISGNKRSSILHWCLSPKDTAMLTSRCHEKQSSVQSAICAAFLLSIAQEMNSPEGTVHKCVSPCNVRNYLVPAIGEDFGLYISGLFTSHTLKPETSFWGLAQEVKHQINDLIMPEKMFQYIRPTKAFLSTQPDPQMVYQQMTQKGDLCVTNLGRLNITQQFGSLYLEAIYGPIVQSSENIKIVGIATMEGKMFFTFTFSESVLPRSQAEKIKATAMRCIAKVVADSNRCG